MADCRGPGSSPTQPSFLDQARVARSDRTGSESSVGTAATGQQLPIDLGSSCASECPVLVKGVVQAGQTAVLHTEIFIEPGLV